MYAFSSGFPIWVVAFLGNVVHARMPNVLSITDYSQRRFGLAVQLFAAALCLFNMGIGLTAEYTAIGVRHHSVCREPP
jgi:Na+/proline symporter